MSDIIDIVCTLTYDVDDSDLKTNIDAIKGQNALIEQQKVKLVELQKQYKETTNPVLQENLKKKIDSTTQSINTQTAALTVQISNNKKLNTAISEEIGLISKLEKTLSNLQEGKRFATNAADIKAYTKDIREVEKELANLKGLGSNEGGILASILGFNTSGGSLGKQLLNGTLLGLGVGGGFGLITRAASGLVDGLTELGQAYFDTDKNQEAFRQHSEQLTASLIKEVENLNKLDEQLRFIDTNETSEALKREVELIRAKGVVQGEVFKSQKEIFEAEQKQRTEEATQISSNLDNFRKVRDAIDAAARAVKKGVVNEGLTPGSGNFPRIQRVFDNSGADSTALSNVFADIKKSGVTNAINPDLSNALFKARQQFDLKILEEQNKSSDKSNEIDAKDIEFKAKIAEQEYELQKSLTIRLRELRKGLGLQYLKDQEENDRVTEQTIKRQNDIERSEAISKVNDEIELSRKKGVLTTEIEAQYGQVKADINAEFNDKIKQQTIEFHIKQIQQTRVLLDAENKNQLDSLNLQLKNLIADDEDTFGTRQQIAQVQARIELSEANKKYTALFEAAHKNGDDTTELTKEYNQAIEDIQFEANRKSIKVLNDYYSDRLAIISKNEKIAINEVYADNFENISALQKAYDQGLISYERYAYKKHKIELQEQLDAKKNTRALAQEALKQAEIFADQVNKNPNATSGDKANASDAVNKAQINLNNANDGVIQQENTINNERLKNIDKIKQAYLTLTQSIVSAFNTVYEAQLKVLDVQISTQEARVEQARVFLERGNAEAYETEVNRLNSLQEERETVTRKQLELNAILQASNAAVSLTEAIGAVVKAASEGDPYTIALRVAAAVAALVAGIASVKSAFVSAEKFKDGVVDIQGPGTSKSDSIPAYLSKGESVVTAEATMRNRQIIEMMNKGQTFTIPQFKQPSHNINNHYATKMEMKGVETKLDNLIDAVNTNHTIVHNSMDENGWLSMTERTRRKEYNRRK